MIKEIRIDGAPFMMAAAGIRAVTAFLIFSILVFPHNALAVVGLTFLAEEQGVLLDGPRDVSVSGNYAYVANFTRDSLAVLDISNPNDPVFLAEERGLSPGTSLDGPQRLSIIGYPYITLSIRDSLAVIDISNPFDPVWVTETQGPTPNVSLDGVNSVVIAGNYACVTNGTRDSLAVIEITGL